MLTSPMKSFLLPRSQSQTSTCRLYADKPLERVETGATTPRLHDSSNQGLRVFRITRVFARASPSRSFTNGSELSFVSAAIRFVHWMTFTVSWPFVSSDVLVALASMPPVSPSSSRKAYGLNADSILPCGVSSNGLSGICSTMGGAVVTTEYCSDGWKDRRISIVPYGV